MTVSDQPGLHWGWKSHLLDGWHGSCSRLWVCCNVLTTLECVSDPEQQGTGDVVCVSSLGSHVRPLLRVLVIPATLVQLEGVGAVAAPLMT